MTRAKRRLLRRLGALAAHVSPALALLFPAYLQSKRNTSVATFNGELDGERASADLKRIVSFGPRPSGSEALERCRAFIIGALRSAKITVRKYGFLGRERPSARFR